MTRVPLDLNIQVEDANGRVFRWGPDEIPSNRLRNVSFSTKIGEGFSSAQGQLSRRIDLDYPDLGLVDTVTFTGADGSVAWEGRVSAMPRELSDAHSIGVTLTGWMAHAKDRKFREVYVDRDLGAWGAGGTQRKANMLSLNQQPKDPTQGVDEGNNAAVILAFDGAWISPYIPWAEAWYDAGPGVKIKRITATFTKRGILAGVTGGPAWNVTVIGASDDTATVFSSTVNLMAASNPTGVTHDPNLTTTECRYAVLQLFCNSAPGGADGLTNQIDWTNIAVYGQYATYRQGEVSQPAGVVASDVIRDIAARHCPVLDTSGVRDTSYVIQHLAFKDPVFPYDAFLEVNKYHLWNLAVWENKTLHFGPHDLTDYDWQVRTYDPGVEFSPQGPSIDDTFNGIEVIYQDVLKGIQHRLTPDTNSDLVSMDPTNPWNVHGMKKWDEIRLSTPSTQAAAVALGRAALAERVTPKTPGTIKVSGYIRDRQGVHQPAWKVRAGDTITVTDFPNDQPRLIVETSWDDERKELSLSVDRPFALLDAYIDRLGNAVEARNIR